MKKETRELAKLQLEMLRLEREKTPYEQRRFREVSFFKLKRKGKKHGS